jgi:hypothetical protein
VVGKAEHATAPYETFLSKAFAFEELTLSALRSLQFTIFVF